MSHVRVSLWIAMTLALAPRLAVANDGVFGGKGVHPIPMTTESVRMADEKVTLRLDAAKRAWHVECSFVFESDADEPVTLTVGFPFPVYEPDFGDIAVPSDARAPAAHQPLVWDFRTFVRGKPVTARKVMPEVNPELPRLEYGSAYVWEVTFAPRERVTIRNTYRHGVSEVVGGLVFANYVLGTGATWKGGRIGHARLSVQVPGARFTLCPAEEAGGDPVTPAGYRVSPLHDGPGFEVHWSLADFAPEADLSVCVQDLDAHASMHLGTQLLDVELDGLSAEELRRLRNEIYARRGQVFQDRELRAHFHRQWWYVPDPAFTPNRLSQEERELVARIRAAEKARPPAEPK